MSCEEFNREGSKVMQLIPTSDRGINIHVISKEGQFVNKKFIFATVVLLMMSILVAGCGPGRDLSTLSTTMVGHWGYFGLRGSEPFEELYFGEFDEQGIGSCISVEPNETLNAVCTILEETGDNVRMNVTSEDGLFLGSLTLYPAKDGQTMMWYQQEFQYIDSKTEP